jgi:hypothetical protein
MRPGRRRFLQQASVLGGAVLGLGLLREAGLEWPQPEAAQPSPKPTVSLRAGDFGVRGDRKWDQNAAFLRLRDRMAANHDVHYHVAFRPGVYFYSNNRWLQNVGSVTLDAEGCTFVNISSDPFDVHNRPFNAHSMFSHGAGFRIHPASAGTVVVRLADLAGAAEIAAGARILLHSFDQQWHGYPPNLRFFEWHRVAAADAASGTIILDAPLRYSHDSALPDTLLEPAAGLTVGSARILPLERRDNRYPELIEIVGATFARNPNRPPTDARGLVIPADTLVLRDCRHAGWVWPSENREALYERCWFENAEADKLCDRVTFRGCRFAGPVLGATGVNELVLEDCEIQGRVGVSPRVARLRRNRILVGDASWGAISSYFDSWPVELLDCQDNEVVHQGSLSWAIDPGAPEKPQRLVVDGRGPGNEILLADTKANRDGVIRQLIAGTRLQLQGTGTAAILERIAWTSGEWSLSGSWSIRVEPGQVWEFSNVQTIREVGTRLRNEERPVLRKLLTTQTRLR